MKQEIKQAMNLPVDTTMSIEKSNNFRACITISYQSELSQKLNKQIGEDNLPTSNLINSDYLPRPSLIRSEKAGDLMTERRLVPLFILHRVLII